MIYFKIYPKAAAFGAVHTKKRIALCAIRWCGKQDLNSSGYPPKPLKYGAFSVSVSPFSKVVSPICRVAMTGLSLNISKIVSNIVSLIYFRAESSFVI